MFSVQIDSKALEKKLTRIARVMPKAVADTLNVSAFEVRDASKTEIQSVFDRPAPLTQNAPLYRKATPQNLFAEVFIRREARGTHPRASTCSITSPADHATRSASRSSLRAMQACLASGHQQAAHLATSTAT